MRMRSVRLFWVLALALLALDTLSATDVLLPEGSQPRQVVLVRKLVMQSQAANLGDIQAKLGAGNITAIAANARSLAATATFLPVLFDQAYPEAYPIQGSPYFYRGAPPDAVRTVASDLNTAAEALAAQAAANNRSGVEAALPGVQATCGACHGAYRGQY